MGAQRPKHAKKTRKHAPPSPTSLSAPQLLAQSAALLQQGQPEAALEAAQSALKSLSPGDDPTPGALPALALLGEIHLELGDPMSAREAFLMAADLDPQGAVAEGAGGGPEKFMWLAQLSEEGGRESLGWYEKGVEALQRGIAEREGKKGMEAEVEDMKKKLSNALCGMIEVWMTDLSFEDDAETQCENLITRALMLSPEPYASTLQTLASIRLSQAKLEDAESALTRSLDLWKDLPLEHPDRPDFPTRISLTRLLMEAEMEDTALDVVEVLVGEDDESVEAWYLGGWCLHLMASKTEATNEEEKKEQHTLYLSSREWLRNCLKLYDLLEYEDERLGSHAKELVAELDKELGDAEIEEDGEEEEWEDDDEDEDLSDADGDHAMEGA